jgi:phosphoribosylanthranilate isomerase
MNRDDISYALAKQLVSAYAIESSYGHIELDEELRDAVDVAVRPILERRLASLYRLGGPRACATRPPFNWAMLDHDAVAVQICLAGGLDAQQAATVLTRIKGAMMASLGIISPEQLDDETNPKEGA